MPRRLHVLAVAFVCVVPVLPGRDVAAASMIQDDKPVSRARIEALLKDDLAKRLKVRADQLTVLSAHERTWTDASLGCSARKGVVEPVSIPGFEITLAHAGRQYVYHTDRTGRFRRCDAGKSVGPISSR